MFNQMHEQREILSWEGQFDLQISKFNSYGWVFKFKVYPDHFCRQSRNINGKFVIVTYFQRETGYVSDF